MEQERLRFSIERFDHYYDSINNKCSVFLTLSTFIVGGLVAGYPWLLEKVDCGICIHLIMAVLLSLGLAIMIVVTFTSIPFLSAPSCSFLFFGDIADRSFQTFADQSKVETDEAAKNDLRGQAHVLATGLTAKFKRLKLVGILMLIQFILFIPLILTIIFNLK
jgi:hypothetical protein